MNVLPDTLELVQLAFLALVLCRLFAKGGSFGFEGLGWPSSAGRRRVRCRLGKQKRIVRRCPVLDEYQCHPRCVTESPFFQHSAYVQTIRGMALWGVRPSPSLLRRTCVPHLVIPESGCYLFRQLHGDRAYPWLYTVSFHGLRLLSATTSILPLDHPAS